MGAQAGRRSGLSWLALGYGLLVVYASLHPFAPWAWPDGLVGWNIVRLEWPRYWSAFDVWANAAGYVPLGLLVFAAAWRSGAGGRKAIVLGLLLPALLAYTLELAQRFVALRVPSLADWLLNSGGAALGCVLAALAGRLGWLSRWDPWRARWFVPQSAGALALLALWPLGLVFPLPAPLAQGQFLPRTLAALETALHEAGWLTVSLRLGTQVTPLEHMGATVLGLLAPCLLLLAVARPGWARVGLVAGLTLAGIGVSALSAALGFGPANAWAWLDWDTARALALAFTVAVLAAGLPPRANAVLAVPVLTGLILLVARMSPDPYLVLSQQQWELGPRVQLYGLLQWLGWLWPLLALGWVMTGLVAQPPKGRT